MPVDSVWNDELRLDAVGGHISPRVEAGSGNAPFLLKLSERTNGSPVSKGGGASVPKQTRAGYSSLTALCWILGQFFFAAERIFSGFSLYFRKISALTNR